MNTLQFHVNTTATGRYALTPQTPGDNSSPRLETFLNRQTAILDLIVTANDSMLDLDGDSSSFSCGSTEARLEPTDGGKMRCVSAEYSNLAGGNNPPNLFDDVHYRRLPDGCSEWQRNCSVKDEPPSQKIVFDPARQTLTVLED